ncbi:MAG: hypothetical protein IPJ52_09380 [Rhodocyclaceae bacterium]|nr:hypothetical protein [Rhodocyclaceae bacterium]
MRGIEIGEAKYGKHPEHDGIVERQVDDVIAGSRRVTVVPTKISAMFGVAGFGIYGRVYKLKDGRYLLEQNNGSHIDKKKAFWIIGDDLDAVLDRGEARLKNSDAAVGRARTSKISKPLRAELEEEFGKVFEYEISNASNSSSFYITHKPSGIKIRISDHDLPSYYENTADIDLRKEDAETGEALQESDVAHALRAEIARRNGAPTPSVDPDSIGSRSLGASRNEMQERPAVRADESGSLEEPAQSGGGAGSGANIPRLSRAVPPAPTSAKTADDIIGKPAATPRPLDAVMKGITKAVGLPKLTGAIYNKAAFFLDRFTPEAIKAGMVADYGIPEAVIDARAVMEGRQRQQLRGAGALLEKLSTLTRAESRVAYEWMNNDDPQAADYFDQQLPEESVKVLKEVRDLVDSMSKEAIRLGQLSPEAYERNKFAYLRRSYVKHTAELTGAEAKGRARAIAILGDQYKRRGMTDAVDMAKFKNAAPEWWNRKTQQGKADKQLKGEKFIRLERRAPAGAGTSALQGFGEKQRGRLLEVAYWPAGEPIPARYGSWGQSGTWEVRDTKGGKLVVWRDFTKQEREAMGEIDEARYAIAKTLHGMIHDVEVGKYLEWLGQNYAKKDGEQIDGEIVEASERMLDVFKPGEWVQVPETKIAGTQVKKYGTLAGRYLPGRSGMMCGRLAGEFDRWAKPMP